MDIKIVTKQPEPTNTGNMKNGDIGVTTHRGMFILCVNNGWVNLSESSEGFYKTDPCWKVNLLPRGTELKITIA